MSRRLQESELSEEQRSTLGLIKGQYEELLAAFNDVLVHEGLPYTVGVFDLAVPLEEGNWASVTKRFNETLKELNVPLVIQGYELWPKEAEGAGVRKDDVIVVPPGGCYCCSDGACYCGCG